MHVSTDAPVATPIEQERESNMSRITNEAGLLNWLAEQLKQSDPKTNMLEGFVHVFDDVVSIFNESGRLSLWHSDWSDYLQEIFGIINRFPAQQVCSENILDFLNAIYGVAIERGDHVTRRRAIRVLMELLDIDDHLIRRERIGKHRYLISTTRFEERYGTSVRVRHKRKKRIKIQSKIDFFTI
jgi:hypothetical protein